MFRLMAAAVLALGATAVFSQLPGKRDEEIANMLEGNERDYEADHARATAICERVRNISAPPSDHPTASEAKALNGCDSEDLYYGISLPADPDKARKCAFIEGNPHDQPLRLHNEDGMLMMIYANGRGAERNFDVALHYACQINDSQAAWDMRVNELQKRNDDGWRGENFESCEHVTSGLAQGYCASHQSALDDQIRRRQIAEIGRNWTQRQRQLFDAAYKSAEDYAGSLHAMDCFRGTAQWACNVIGANEWMEDFVKRIEGIGRGHADELEARTDAQRRKAAMEAASNDEVDWIDDGDKHWYEENDRETAAKRVIFERSFVAFARATYPSVTSHRIRRIFADM